MRREDRDVPAFTFVVFFREELSKSVPISPSPQFPSTTSCWDAIEAIKSHKVFPSFPQVASPASHSLTSSPTPSREGSLSPQSSPRGGVNSPRGGGNDVTSGDSSPRDVTSSSEDEAESLAVWINKEAGMFLIKDKNLFAKKWFAKKVLNSFLT